MESEQIIDSLKLNVHELPSGWKIKKIDDLVNEKAIYKPTDGNHGNIHPKASDYVTSGIPFIMANGVTSGSVELRNCSFISKVQADLLQKGFSIAGDVLLTHKGTVGNTAIVPKLETDYIMLTPQVTYYRVRDVSKILNVYIKLYFESPFFQRILKELSGGGTRAYIGITEQRNLPFILPPLPQQHKIAATLSTWDDAIQTAEQLLNAQQERKRGLMQQLLTGQKRLPGFSEEWHEVKAGEIFRNISIKNHPNEELCNSGSRCYPALNVRGSRGNARKRNKSL